MIVTGMEETIDAAIIKPQLVDASPRNVITSPEARVLRAVSVTRVMEYSKSFQLQTKP